MIFNNYIFYIISYIISSCFFNRFYKLSTVNMKSSYSVTIIINLIASFFSLIFIFLYDFKMPNSFNIYLLIFISIIFYTLEYIFATLSRSNIEISIYGCLKQLSVVFIILFGIIFLKEKIIIRKAIGILLILISNVLLILKKKNFSFNKYLLYGVVANFFLAIALFIDSNLSSYFNLGIYLFLITFIPALLIFIVKKVKLSDIFYEFKLGGKNSFIMTGLFFVIMMISKLRAYQLENVVIVSTFCSLSVLINTVFSYLFFDEKDDFIKKIVACFFIVLGIILIKCK